MANEGLRPYWYDSSLTSQYKYNLRFYYPADIDSIMILDKITGSTATLRLKKEGEYLYNGNEYGGISRNGDFNNGNTVIYDHRQNNPIYSNRISRR